jgi:hypothetical protein
MQPSGEVGRFEVVNLPSPPADRRRSSCDSDAAMMIDSAVKIVRR